MNGNTDTLLKELDGFRSAVPPASLIADARTQAAANKRAMTSRRKHRSYGASLAAAALFGLAFTPPGRAATGWVGRVAGVGDEPTLNQRDAADGSARVLTSGTLGDGTDYELVVKHLTEASRPGPMPGGVRFPDSLCFQLEFPGYNLGGAGGLCGTSFRTGSGNKYLSAGVMRSPSGSGDSAIFFGVVPLDVVSVKASATSEDGTQTPLDPEFLTADRDYVESIGGSFPISMFLLPLNADEIGSGIQSVTLSAFDEAGNLVDERTTQFP